MPTVGFAPPVSDSLENLEETIKIALQKTGTQKEMDLCAYIPDRDGQLLPSTYLKLKDADRQTLYDLIKRHILDADPHKIPIPPGVSHPEQPYTGKPLKKCVQEAMEKLNVQNETALCRYIPHREGYIHHFTYLKMKSANPVQARNLIQKHILDKRVPQRVPHKQRKRRGNRENDVANAADVEGRLNRDDSEVNQPSLSPPACSNKQKKSIPRNPQDGKIDQILRMMNQLAESIGRPEAGVVQDTVRPSTEHSTSRASIEECLHVLQQELIMKIIKKKADQKLWIMFTQLTKL